MNIALISHDNKKELMDAFCIAYKGILEKHDLYSTGNTGLAIIEATGLNIHLFSSGVFGEEQIAARIVYNEMDLVIFFLDHSIEDAYSHSQISIFSSCDMNNIPFATNIATAEVLINGVERGDFAWRDNVRPEKSKGIF